MQRGVKDEAPKIIVPTDDPATLESELGVHQHVSKELHTLASTDEEEEDSPIFP